MKVVKKTKAYTIYKKASGRFAVKDADNKWINAEAKVKILVDDGFIKAFVPPVKEEVVETPAVEEVVVESPAAEAPAEEQTSEAPAAEEVVEAKPKTKAKAKPKAKPKPKAKAKPSAKK